MVWVLRTGNRVLVGKGACVIQSFEPIPLYSAMVDLGFEHLTERISDLFEANQPIKILEGKGKSHAEIMDALLEK